MGALTYLTSLDLSHNQIGGPLPPTLGNLSQLCVLDLSANRFAGAVPAEFGATVEPGVA